MRNSAAARHDRAASLRQPPLLDAATKLQAALCELGFRRSDASAAVAQALSVAPGLDMKELLRKCLLLLVPAAS